MDHQAAPSPEGTAARSPSRSPSWPAVAYERRAWHVDPAAALSRRRRAEHAGPYEAAVIPEIATVAAVPLAVDVLALADDASREVTRFDTEMGGDLAPFAAVLLRSESAASSRIENLTASATAIALAELGDPSKRNAGVIVANTRAMRAAVDLADHLDEQAILDMQAALVGDSHPDWVGRWRDQQVWIGGSAHGPHGALFVPPHHDRVAAAMHDLVAFMDRDDLPVLVQAAVAHAQFETIHPFPDGNGRTGRALVHCLLRGKDVTRNVTAPLSAGLLGDVDSYFDALTRYRAGDPAPIVERMADATFAAVGNGRQLVGELRGLRTGWDDRIHARRDAAVHRLADLLTRQPVVDSPLVQRELAVAAPSANRAIDQLVELGVLRKVSGRHRYRKWAATEVLAALDAFAARADRRTRAS